MTEFLPRRTRRTDAMQFTGGYDNALQIDSWIGDLHKVTHYAQLLPTDPEHLLIRKRGSANLRVRIELNSWVVKSSNDTVFACDPGTFDWMYETVPAPTPAPVPLAVYQIPRASGKTAARLIAERRAAGLTAADLPKSYAIAEPAPTGRALEEAEIDAIGKIVWDTSRADEGTISATGAKIVAKALVAAGYRMQSPLVEATFGFSHEIADNPDGDPYIGGLFRWKNEKRDRRIRIISLAPATQFYGPGYYYRTANPDGRFTGRSNRVRILALTLEALYVRA